MSNRRKKNNPDFQPLSACRLCGAADMALFLDMGKLPLVNSFFKTQKEKAPSFPVQVYFCPDCGFIQLGGAVNPNLIFSNYAYRSSLSKTFQEHCSKLAAEVVRRFPKLKNGAVLDLGSNDGCLLQAFKTQGFETLGVEPGRELAKIARKNKIPTIASYWDSKSAKAVLKKGKVQVITATSVLAQVSDVHAFIENCRNALALDGAMVCEVHYAANLIQKNEFDTIYHEHLSYFLLKPLVRLLKEHGLKIIDASSSLVHADALRIWAVHTQSPLAPQSSVAELLTQEERDGLYLPATYLSYKNSVEKIRKQTIDFLILQKKRGKKTAGFGAAAKACVLLNFFGISKDLVSFVVDQTPEKIGRFIGNTGIPIVDLPGLKKEPADFLIIFSWNYAKEIMQKTESAMKKGGCFVLLIPSLRILKGAKDL
ncbi:MAG: class I SAM-dependent methyltransferase [Candidatus Micrarchaeota archaeon]